MRGLTDIEIETLVRLAAAACADDADGQPDALASALDSFSEPNEVRDMGARVWRAIEAGQVF